MIKRIFKGIGNVFICGIVLIVLLMSVLMSIGIRPYITLSGSMEPNIMTGSVCFVNTNVNFDEVKTDDIIAFKTDSGTLVTHRVLNISEDGIETKGDNNDVSDGITTNETNFVGQTMFSIPYIGYGLIYLKQPLGMLIIGICVVMLLLLNVVDIIDMKKKKCVV